MMGIRPNRNGVAPPVTPDNPETRYSDWLTDLEDSGEIVGGVWQETDAKASSGNDGTTDLAGRVAAMEAVSSTSGTGWTAQKSGKVVTVQLNGLTATTFTLPEGYRPLVSSRSTAWGDTGVVGRVIASTSGVVTLYDTLGTTGIRAFGSLTLITP